MVTVSSYRYHSNIFADYHKVQMLTNVLQYCTSILSTFPTENVISPISFALLYLLALVLNSIILLLQYELWHHALVNDG
jgi:hypothetical protein